MYIVEIISEKEREKKKMEKILNGVTSLMKKIIMGVGYIVSILIGFILITMLPNLAILYADTLGLRLMQIVDTDLAVMVAIWALPLAIIYFFAAWGIKVLVDRLIGFWRRMLYNVKSINVKQGGSSIMNPEITKDTDSSTEVTHFDDKQIDEIENEDSDDEDTKADAEPQVEDENLDDKRDAELRKEYYDSFSSDDRHRIASRNVSYEITLAMIRDLKKEMSTISNEFIYLDDSTHSGSDNKSAIAEFDMMVSELEQLEADAEKYAIPLPCEISYEEWLEKHLEK